MRMVAGANITPYINTYVKIVTFDAINGAINSVPNVPPVLKILATFGVQGAKTREIINFVRKSDMPAAAKALAVGLGTIGSTMQLVALLPTLQSAFANPANFFGAGGT